MRTTTAIVLLTWGAVGCAPIRRSDSAATIPPFLVGVWADSSAEFQGETLVRGAAFYLDADGMFALIAAPPPVGGRGTATYDARTSVTDTRFEMGDSEGPPPGPIRYNATKRTVEIGRDGPVTVLHRRRADIPNSIKSLMREPRRR